MTEWNRFCRRVDEREKWHNTIVSFSPNRADDTNDVTPAESSWKKGSSSRVKYDPFSFFKNECQKEKTGGKKRAREKRGSPAVNTPSSAHWHRIGRKKGRAPLSFHYLCHSFHNRRRGLIPTFFLKTRQSRIRLGYLPFVKTRVEKASFGTGRVVVNKAVDCSTAGVAGGHRAPSSFTRFNRTRDT